VFLGTLAFALAIAFALFSYQKGLLRKSEENDTAPVYAFVDFFGQVQEIDGRHPVRGEDYVIGSNLQAVVRLVPGEHHFRGRFSATTHGRQFDTNWVSDSLDLNLFVEPGGKYRIALFTELPDPDTVLYQEEFIGGNHRRKMYLAAVETSETGKWYDRLKY